MVMERLVAVTAPQVEGAHDAEMVLVDDHAYIVAEVSDVSAGESAGRPEIYRPTLSRELPTVMARDDDDPPGVQLYTNAVVR